MKDAVVLTGRDLTLGEVSRVLAGAPVRLAERSLERMTAARAVIDTAIDEGRPVYGVTTGLGPRVVEALPRDELAAFAVATVRGRAHAVGGDLPGALCRAGLLVRLNTLLIGAAGVRPALAEMMAACLNEGLAPALRDVGSIGAADLMWGGDFGLALIGEGRMWYRGDLCAAGEALARAGIAPWDPAPREGLALVSHSCISAGLAAVVAAQGEAQFEAAQTAAALVMEGFRANLSVLSPDLLALRPQAGQAAAAAGLARRLEGSALHRDGAARRLQDPLSIRNLPQVHGAVRAALDTTREVVHAEINGASDNPGVMVERGEVASHGGYLSPYLLVTLGALSQSLSLMAACQCARIGKMNAERFTGLPNGLSAAPGMGAGFAPVMKTAEALMAEVLHAGAPPPVYPGLSADGLEDVSCHTAIAGKAVLSQLAALRRLSAIEAVAGARAIWLREQGGQPPGAVAPGLRPALVRLWEVSPPDGPDRPLGHELEQLADRLGEILAPG